MYGRDIDGVSIGDLRLMLLLYADDAVILSDTPHGLQNILARLHIYAQEWKLELNTTKTKIMVFRKGGRLPQGLNFNYNNVNLEIVNNFVYLGVVFTPSGAFSNAQKTISDQARKAMFKLLKYIRSFVSIKPSVCIELFDELVKPVLMYGAEVWGFHTGQFCKRLLRVKRGTPTDIVLGEARRVDMKTWRYISIIKYWVKILTMSDHRYVYKVYHTLKLDYEDGKTNWVLCVKQLLYSCGLGEAWVSQYVGSDKVFMSLFKRRVFDMYQQDWNSRLSSTSRGTLYTNINIDVDFVHVSYEHFESVKLSSDMYSIIKLRTSSHRLGIETGRWHKPQPIPLLNRICEVCNQLDDEYHFVLECSRHTVLRHKYIPNYFYRRPSMYKFMKLLSDANLVTRNRLATFVRLGFEQRYVSMLL